MPGVYGRPQQVLNSELAKAAVNRVSNIKRHCAEDAVAYFAFLVADEGTKTPIIAARNLETGASAKSIKFLAKSSTAAGDLVL